MRTAEKATRGRHREEVVAAARPAGPTAGATRPFRSDIQGLRAIAVALVVVYHIWPSVLPGGYVGVDVFFVISGFLITGHLLETRDTGGRGLVRFWARRIRRLLPAALFVLATTVVAAALLLPDLLWAQTAWEALAATFYVENWRLAGDAVDYLAADGPASLVQHYWSLSVEEQFYVVWPVLLLATGWIATRAGRSKPAVATVLIAVATVASLAASIWLTRESPSDAYFATQARMWEFGFGALLAALTLRYGLTSPSPRRWRSVVDGVVGWCGIAAVVYAGFTFTASTPFPGWAALLPVGGTAAVIATQARRTSLGPARLLGTAPFQLVGDLSYSLYLWHWPVVAVANNLRFGRDLGWLAGSAVLLVSLGLAWPTKRFVEDRFRPSPRRHPLRTTYVQAVAGMAVVAALGGLLLVGVDVRDSTARDQLASAVAKPSQCFGAGSLAQGADCPKTSPAAVVPAPLIAKDERTEAYGDGCFSEPPFVGMPSCTYGDPDAKVSIALVGNSHAGQWFAAVKAIALERGAKVTTFLASGCTVTSARLVWPGAGQADGCVEWGRKVVAETSTAKYDLIVTSEIATRLVEGGTLATRQADWRDGYLGVLRQWQSHGKHVLVLRDSPRLPTAMTTGPACVAANSSHLSTCSSDRRNWIHPDALAVAAKAMKSDLISVADVTSRICSSRCSAVVGGVLVFYDSHHMTDTFVNTLVPYLRTPIEQALDRSVADHTSL